MSRAGPWDTDSARAAVHYRPSFGRYLAEHIPGATLVELPGADCYPFYSPASEDVLHEIGRFLTDESEEVASQRELATVLFTDVVGSTDLAAHRGDDRWLGLRGAHDEIVRRNLAAFRGREVATTGDGFLATFDGPARALRCASRIRQAVRSIGLEIRQGLHTGEVELLERDIGGIAVHLAARIMALAGPSEILVSGTVTDLVVRLRPPRRLPWDRCGLPRSAHPVGHTWRMNDEQPESDLESQRRFEELSDQVAANRINIDALQSRADEANHRADASEHRADDDRRRVDKLEARVDVDEAMIAELQADGVLSREHTAQLEEALRSSRRIGAAIGIVMANDKVREQAAFEILSKASQDTNRKLRLLADELVETGDVSCLPRAGRPARRRAANESEETYDGLQRG